MAKETPPRGVRPGAVLDGRYRIDTPLGAGGMGTVFRGTQLELDRAVAIKLIGDGRAASPEQQTRFEREARLLARLSHPAIVTVHDFGRTADGTWYLVMELVKGESVAARIERAGALHWREVASLGRLMAEAIDAAHAAGILHRDLKPANVMLASAAAVPIKLIDFGLARLDDVAGRVGAAPLTASDYVVGTAGYIAPEYAWTGTATESVDHYALGVVLFEMLTAQHPFAGSGTDRAAHARDTLITRTPDAPDALHALVLSLLEKEPERRARDAAAQLARLLSGALASVSEPPAPAPRGSPARERLTVEGRRRPLARPTVAVPGGLVRLDLDGRRIDVQVPPFAIDKHLVTFADYLTFLDATGAAPPAPWGGRRPKKDNLGSPVVDVTFAEAHAFAQWSGRRLPTEAEWELAARGPERRAYPWGETWQVGLSHPVHMVPPEQRAAGPIGVFSPQGDSVFGVADLCAVWEWVVAPYQMAGNVVRGGPWRDRPVPAELSNRSWDDGPGRDIGFRCAT